MNLSNDLNVSSLMEILLFANTPNYVYKNLRRKVAVEQLATKYSKDQLISEYHSRVSKPDKSTEDIVIAYAMLVGLTFLDYPKALEAINKLDLSLITWGHEIRDIFISTAKTVNVFNISPQALLRPPIIATTSDSTQTKTINMSKEE